jgi:toxin ParE1/3/4
MSARRLVQRPRARRDVLAIVAYLADRNPRAAHDFLAAHQRSLATLRAYPEAGRRYRPDHAALEGLRVMAIPGFADYLIFRRYDGATVDVIRVLHGARDILAILALER